MGHIGIKFYVNGGLRLFRQLSQLIGYTFKLRGKEVNMKHRELKEWNRNVMGGWTVTKDTSVGYGNLSKFERSIT